MHKLALVKIPALVLTLTLVAAPVKAGPSVVVVLYAASLVTPLEGPVAEELYERGIHFSGEPGGSQKLANLIAAGLRTPDVFIAVDPAIVAALGSRVASATTFANTSLGIAWSPKSRFANVLERAAAGKISVLAALQTPGLRIGRTDPQLDPKGRYTVAAMRAIAGTAREQQLLGADENPDQIFPEEDLLARVETGEIDAGFFYRTEAVTRGYRFAPLPRAVGTTVAYVLAVMAGAPHAGAARQFADFILHGDGRAILERAGLTYTQRAR